LASEELVTVRRSTWLRVGLWSGAAFLALLVAAAIGFQNNIFRHAMDPRTPFQTMVQPPAPNYADAAAWAARPDQITEGAAAIFFVHPTTFWGGDAWNAAIDNPVAAARVDQGALPTYAGAFAPLGDVWAPRYRQASLYSSLTHRFDARQARALAYNDVLRSFRVFLAEAPPDAPILLVGVEQGGLHVLGLLQEMFASEQLASEPLRSRLVAAYVIDQATPLELFDGPLGGLKACQAPEDWGCVVSWGAFEEHNGASIEEFRRRSMAWTADGRLEPTEGHALLCVNPISGSTAEDYMPARTHHGAVDATGLAIGVEPAPLAAQTSAQCSDGVLLIDRPASPSLRPGWRWGGRFMPRTAFLFYIDARRDAERRLAAFRGVAAAAALEGERQRAEDTLPPLETIEIRRSPINRVPD
jgi:hypothetical protein